MNRRLAIWSVLSVIGLLLFSIYLWGLFSRPAFQQKVDEVVIREPGERFLGPPQPATAEARKDLEFAWLSEAAYQRVPDNQESHGNCLDADSALQNRGWSRWENFPDADLRKKIAISHLRVEVWTNPLRDAVTVAFGGTTASSGKDWKSNLRWFIPRRDDEYTEIVAEFGPAFVNEFLRRKQEPAWAYLNKAAIFATGHSLGGGLAQQFAYSLPINKDVPRVKKVFAFDPSPVTGFGSVNQSVRNNNKQNLAIDRIYQRGEILAHFRSITYFIAPPSASNPAIRHVRYNLFSRRPIAGHSISDLACKLDEVSR
jgi:hypothetical protein